MSESSSGSGTLETELIGLVQGLTAEVLLRKPTDLPECCALFCERKLRERDRIAGAKAQSHDRKLAKLRMCHFAEIEKKTTENSISEKDNDSPKDPDKSPVTPDESPDADVSDNGEKIANRKKHHVGSAKTPLRRGSRNSPDVLKKNEYYEKEFDSLGVPHEINKTKSLPDIAKLPTICERQSSSATKTLEVKADIHHHPNSSEYKIVRTNSYSLQRLNSAGSDSNIFSNSTSSMSQADPLESSSRSFFFGKSEEANRSSSPSKEHILTFTGHRNIVTQCLVLNKYVLSASLDATIRIWSISTGERVEVLNCQRPVHCMQCITVREGEVILLAALEIGKILTWKLITANVIEPKLVGEYAGHLPNPVRAMAFSEDHGLLATGCCFIIHQIGARSSREGVRGSLKTWDLTALITDTMTNDGHYTDRPPLCSKTMQQLMSLTLRPKDQLAGPYSYNTMGQPLEEVWWGIRALAFTPDASRLVVGFGHPDDEEYKDQQLLAVCCSQTLDTLWVQDRSMCQINSLDFMPVFPDDSMDFDSWEMVIGAQNSLTKISVIAVGEKKADVIYHWSNYLSEDHFGAIYGRHGDFIASAVGSGLCFWDRSSGRKLKEMTGHSDQITCVAFSPDGSIVCTASDDFTVMIWEVPSAFRSQNKGKKSDNLTKRRSSELLTNRILKRNQKKTITY